MTVLREDAISKLDIVFESLVSYRRFVASTSEVKDEATARLGISALEGLDAVRAWLRGLTKEPE